MTAWYERENVYNNIEDSLGLLNILFGHMQLYCILKDTHKVY